MILNYKITTSDTQIQHNHFWYPDTTQPLLLPMQIQNNTATADTQIQNNTATSDTQIQCNHFWYPDPAQHNHFWYPDRTQLLLIPTYKTTQPLLIPRHNHFWYPDKNNTTTSDTQIKHNTTTSDTQIQDNHFWHPDTTQHNHFWYPDTPQHNHFWYGDKINKTTTSDTECFFTLLTVTSKSACASSHSFLMETKLTHRKHKKRKRKKDTNTTWINSCTSQIQLYTFPSDASWECKQIQKTARHTFMHQCCLSGCLVLPIFS